MEKKKDGFTDQRAIIIPNDIIKKIQENDLTKLLYVTDVGAYPEAKSHYRERDTGIEQNILIFCYAGEGWYDLGNGRKTIKANEFFIIEAFKPHKYGASQDNPWSIYWMHFGGDKSANFGNIFNVTVTLENSAEARFQDRFLMFEEIIKNLNMGYSIEILEYVTLTLFHLIASLRYVPQFREIKKTKPIDIIQKIINYMQNNIDKKITLEEIAEYSKYSPAYISNLFSQKTGMTVIEYFNHLKIQQACKWLDFSDLKIKEIAYNLGFYDQYYFSKVFNKYMSISPVNYRKNKKG